MVYKCLALLLVVACSQVSSTKDGPVAADATALDELIARSCRIDSCRARFRITAGHEVEPGTIQIDLVANEGMRIEIRGSESGESVIWARDPFMVFRSHYEGERRYARINMRELGVDLTPVRAALAREFGAPPPTNGTWRPAVDLDWSVDASTGHGEVSFIGMLHEHVESPFGWLSNLSHRRLPATMADGSLCFVAEDGRVEVHVSAENGLLRRFVGRGPDSTTTVELLESELNVELPPGWLDLPDRAADEVDVSDSCARSTRSTFVSIARRTTWRTILDSWEIPFNAAAETRARAVLHPVQEIVLAASIEQLTALGRPWIEEMRTWVAKSLVGRDAASIEDSVAKSRSQLAQNLDKLIAQGIDTIPAPDEFTTSPHATELLAIERQVAEAIFRDRLRDPLLNEFDKATALDR